MDKEQTKKALEQLSLEGCMTGVTIKGHSVVHLLIDALALINSQDQKIFELENRLKECENGYEGTLALERAKVKELTEENAELKGTWQKLKESQELACEKCRAEFDKLTEENEKLYRLVDDKIQENKRLTEENERLENICQLYALQYGTATDKEVFLKKERADTVRKMESLLIDEVFKGKCQLTCDDPNVTDQEVRAIIKRIAKEMLEGEK